MLILDTDHFSEFLRGSTAGARLRERLIGHAVAVTIITLEEQARGWLGRIKQARTGLQTIFGYGKLQQLFAASCEWPVLGSNEVAESTFAGLGREVRIGTMDRRIASIALVHKGKLLSRNLKDFVRVPDLDVEDWLSGERVKKSPMPTKLADRVAGLECQMTNFREACETDPRAPSTAGCPWASGCFRSGP